MLFARPIYKPRRVMPKGMSPPPCAVLALEDVYHHPGETAAVRFFDPLSYTDLMAMRDILKGRQVKKWMDDANHLSKSEYRDWAGTVSNTCFLFAVLDARVASLSELVNVRGFVFIYSEREEKFRVRRMEKLGFLSPAPGERYALEISFALRPLTDGRQGGSGIMASAVRQACHQVQLSLKALTKPMVDIFAFVDPENYPAQRTLEAAGFVRRGTMKYDWDSPDESCLYLLNWRLLQRKMRDKLQALNPRPV